MYLLELAAQNVRGFSPSIRAPLKTGYLVLRGPQTVAPVGALVTALLYADGRGGEASFLAPGQRAGKAGLTLLGNDQTTYRLLRELGGPGSLTRYNKATQAFETVSEEAAEIQQYLRGQVGLPTKTAFEQLFVFTPSQLPSRKPKPKPAAPALGASGPKPSLQHNAPVEAASDIGAAEARLLELEQERALSNEVDQLQFQADALSSEAFELESKLKSGEALKAQVADAEAQWNAAPSAESLGLPEDILTRAQRYPALVQKRDEALVRLDSEREQEVAAPPVAVDPLTRNPQFWGGVAGGALCLGLAVFLSGVGKYVGLLDIPAFGFAALVALRYVDDLQASTRVSKKGGMIEAREKKIREEFEREAAPVRMAMRALGVEDPAEIAEVLARKGQLLERVEQLRGHLEQLEGSPEYAEAAARSAEVRQQQEALNAQLTEKGAYVRDARDVEREIGRVKESIRLARQGPAPVQATAAAAPAGEPLEDPFPAVMRLATDLLQGDVTAAWGMLKDRSAQYVSALTDRRLVALDVDREGRGFAMSGQGERLAIGTIPPRDLDLAYLSLRLTVVEKYAARFKVPVLLDDTVGIDDAKLSLFGRMLKHLGTLTQVLQATAHPVFAPLADGQVQL